MEDNGGVVIVECDIVATQCCHVGTDRQSQEAKYLLALLGKDLEGKKGWLSGQKRLFSSVFFQIFMQR